MLKCKYNSQIQYAEAILPNSTRKQLWFEITKMLMAVSENKFIVLFIIIFGTLSFPTACRPTTALGSPKTNGINYWKINWKLELCWTSDASIKNSRASGHRMV